MLKASSLYLVIIISTIIAILTASFITVAFYYRQEYLKNARYSRLSSNLESANTILLSSDFKEYDSDKIIDLFGENADSIVLRKESWGLYDLAVSKAFVLSDTLKKAFLIAKSTEDDQSAIYMSDEDRPLSVSGNTQITGEAFLPKSGVKSSYVNGKPYTGKRLINGLIKVSQRTLPALESLVVDRIIKLFEGDSLDTDRRQLESGIQSFFKGPLVYDLSGSPTYLSNISLQGKIIIISDTTVTISKNAVLKDVIICASSIRVEEGFRGSAQLFALDSIVTGKNVIFEYPSVLGILKPDQSKTQAKIQLSEGSQFSGILFTYEKTRSDVQTIIALGKNSLVKGEVYSTGFVQMDKPLRIDGKVSCNRFIIKTPETLYENYLIDIIINRLERSKYYLSSLLFNDKSKNRVLKWL